MGTCPMRPNCGHYDEQAKRLDQLLGEGKDHDAVVASFVREFGGQAVLTAPIDRGFNRLAWAVPYAVGVVMLGAVFFAARRWATHEPPPAETTIDPALDLVLGIVDEVYAIDAGLVRSAARLLDRLPRLSARDALHAAVMRHHQIDDILTFDAAFDDVGGLRRRPA